MNRFHTLLISALVLFPLAGNGAKPQAESAFDQGQAQEAAKNYQEALVSFRAAAAADPRYALPYAEIGNCQYYLGNKKAALEAYEIYLSMVPDDQIYQKFAARLRTQLGATPPASAPAMPAASPYAKSGSPKTSIRKTAAITTLESEKDMVVELVPNPRNKKTFMILNEIFTPIGFGLDLSYFSSRKHNWGLGYTGGSVTGGSLFLFHPRYRYYQAQSYWSPFFELGGDFLFVNSIDGSGGSMTAADLGFGVNMVNEGPMTVEFLLSLTGGVISSRGAKGSSNYSYPFAIPLIGFAWGLIF